MSSNLTHPATGESSTQNEFGKYPFKTNPDLWAMKASGLFMRPTQTPFSLERSGAKYNESPTKTRTNSMTAYVYQPPNEDGKIFVTATFTDDSGVIIRFENMLIPHSDSKSETTKLSIEEAKRLARLVIEGHFDSDQT